MSVKYDLPNIYVSELQQYQALFVLGDSRTSSGSGSWVSASSGLTYNYTTGQNDLFAQLQTFLEPYLVTASDFNGFVTGTEQNNLFNLLLTPGRYKVTTFDDPTAGDITEAVKLTVDDSTYATFTTEFDLPTSGDITTTLVCSDLGINNKVVTVFNIDGSIVETSSEVV